MIDTVCLLIPKDKLTVLDLSSYGVPTWNLHSKTDQYDKFVKNPSKRDLDSGLYFPRLTGYRRKFRQDANVRIEFSVPKLLYLNNLDELEDSHLISEMNKVNLRKSFDFAKTRFMNDGQSLYAHTTAHQLVIYDKVADLGKDKKRAIDKDQPRYQRSLFDELKEDSELCEVLRFEIRLNHKQKMSKVLEDLGYSKNPTFKDVFNSEMSRKVVESYWQKLIKERNLGLFAISVSIKDILRTLFLADKTLKPKQAIYLLGLFQLARDEDGMRQLRTIISKRSHDRTWYRIAKDMQRASELITKNKLRNWVTQIDKKLSNYQPYKTKKYEHK